MNRFSRIHRAWLAGCLGVLPGVAPAQEPPEESGALLQALRYRALAEQQARDCRYESAAKWAGEALSLLAGPGIAARQRGLAGVESADLQVLKSEWLRDKTLFDPDFKQVENLLAGGDLPAAESALAGIARLTCDARGAELRTQAQQQRLRAAGLGALAVSEDHTGAKLSRTIAEIRKLDRQSPPLRALEQRYEQEQAQSRQPGQSWRGPAYYPAAPPRFYVPRPYTPQRGTTWRRFTK